MNTKKVFLASLIGSLSLSALIGIVIFLVGDFGETQGKVLLTTLTFGLYSLTGLCSSILYEQKRFQAYSIIAIGISILAFLLSLLGIWSPDFELWRATMLSLVLAVGMAHAALLLRIVPKNAAVRWVIILTNIFIAAVVAMLSLLILFEDIGEDFYFRLLGVFAILDALGTIVSPLMQKFSSVAEEPAPENPGPGLTGL